MFEGMVIFKNKDGNITIRTENEYERERFFPKGTTFAIDTHNQDVEKRFVPTPLPLATKIAEENSRNVKVEELIEKWDSLTTFEEKKIFFKETGKDKELSIAFYKAKSKEIMEMIKNSRSTKHKERSITMKDKPRNESRPTKCNPGRKVHAHRWVLGVLKNSTSYHGQRIANEERYYCKCGKTCRTPKT